MDQAAREQAEAMAEAASSDGETSSDGGVLAVTPPS
jgi:hypothetical protein